MSLIYILALGTKGGNSWCHAAVGKPVFLWNFHVSMCINLLHAEHFQSLALLREYPYNEMLCISFCTEEPPLIECT